MVSGVLYSAHRCWLETNLTQTPRPSLMSSLEQEITSYLSISFAHTVVYLGASGTSSYYCIVCQRHISIYYSAIQVFMWLYMFSFYIEASPETRRKRLPYIIASLIMLVLHSAASILIGVEVYTTLFEIEPGPEGLEAGAAIVWESEHLLSNVASLLEDCALRVGELVLVRFLATSGPRFER